MKEYYNYEGMGLREYVMKSNKKEALLKDVDFKNYLLNPANHYAFVRLVEDLSIKDALILLDNAFLERIFKEDTKKTDKYNAIICTKSECLVNASDMVIKYILSDSHLKDCLCYLKEEAIDRFFKYITQVEPEKVYILIYFEDRIVNYITLDTIDVLMGIKQFNNVFIKLHPKAIVKLLKFSKYRNLILELTNEPFLQFCVHMSDVSIEDAFINNTSFLVRVATMENTNYYRDIINHLLKNNYELVEKIEKLRKVYVSNQIKNVENGVFKFYHQVKYYLKKNNPSKSMYNLIPPELYSINDEKSLQELTMVKQFEMLCDLYFKDYAKNVLFNIRELLRFNADKDIIPQDRKELYMKFLDFKSLNQEEIFKLLENVHNVDYASLLYDDIRTSKNLAYKKLNDGFLKLNKYINIYDKAMSEKYGCDVYKLDGEPFMACIHCGEFYNTNAEHETISLSVIGTKNIGTYEKEGLIFGFDHIDVDRIMHVFYMDSYTSGKYSTDRINKIYDPDELLEETHKYNELLYKEKGHANLKPKYVVCMDNIDDISLKYAKENKLPIVIINTLKYPKDVYKQESLENYQTSYKERTNYFGKTN